MPSQELEIALQKLNRGSESVHAVMNMPTSPENRFKRAFAALEALAVGEGIPIAIVGGLAAIHYGYPAVTEDIDVVINRNDLDRLLRDAVKYGFRVTWKADSGWHTFKYGDLEINVVPEGGRARNDAPTVIPGPEKMGVARGVDYAGLVHWMELKLSSWRRKDQTHIVEVLKSNAESIVVQVEKHLASVHSEYVARFRQLATEAQREREQENERGRTNR